MMTVNGEFLFKAGDAAPLLGRMPNIPAGRVLLCVEDQPRNARMRRSFSTP